MPRPSARFWAKASSSPAAGGVIVTALNGASGTSSSGLRPPAGDVEYDVVPPVPLELGKLEPGSQAKLTTNAESVRSDAVRRIRITEPYHALGTPPRVTPASNQYQCGSRRGRIHQLHGDRRQLKVLRTIGAFARTACTKALAARCYPSREVHITKSSAAAYLAGASFFTVETICI